VQSAYEIVFGERLDGLHARLRPYFAAIPPGFVGRGSGVFSVVGTPRRWLWPVLWVLSHQAILFPVWGHDVPFLLENRRVIDANGNVAVAGLRVYQLPGRSRTMVDAITAEKGVLVDYLGTKRRLVSAFEGDVKQGMLRLTSTHTWLRVGARRIGLPQWMAPRVELTERFDEKPGLQSVSVTLRAPLVGLIYEYAGSFGYAVVPESEVPAGAEL
jgi:Domain of unknown function (DUF4166)